MAHVKLKCGTQVASESMVYFRLFPCICFQIQIQEFEKKTHAADLWIYLDVDLLLMPWQRKETVKTTRSLNGPFFRPEFNNHPWRCSSSWEDRMLKQSSSFRTFTSCSKLLSPRANTLVFSCYRATDTGHTRLFPCPPVTVCLLPSPSRQLELVPSSEEFYHAGSALQRRAVVTFSFTTWLYERDVHPVSSLGRVDKNRASEV